MNQHVRTFRDSDVYEGLFEVLNEEMDEHTEMMRDRIVTDSNVKLSVHDVTENDDGTISVVLRDEDGEHGFTTVSGTIEDGDVIDAELKVGESVGPLTGRGYSVHYNFNGNEEFADGIWIS